MKESMIQIIQVTKRDGSQEPMDVDKLHKVVFHACNDITGVSPSDLEIKSQIQFFSGITSKEIQETLIKAAADLISEETPNYQFVGGRLINYGLRKEVYGGYTPCTVKELVEKNTDRGFYDPELLSYYNDEEWDKIDGFIKHARDEDLTYVAMDNCVVSIYVRIVLRVKSLKHHKCVTCLLLLLCFILTQKKHDYNT